MVAKFEAGFETSNGNKTENKKSSIVYTQSQVFVGKAEAGTEQDSRISARNWLDGVYGDKIINISYPIFQGEVYSFNYVNEREAFALCSVLTEKDNIYGLNDETNSHLMKNSEWGDSAYLAQSIYGLNGTNIYINNITLNSGNSSPALTSEFFYKGGRWDYGPKSGLFAFARGGGEAYYAHGFRAVLV